MKFYFLLLSSLIIFTIEHLHSEEFDLFTKIDKTVEINKAASDNNGNTLLKVDPGAVRKIIRNKPYKLKFKLPADDKERICILELKPVFIDRSRIVINDSNGEHDANLLNSFACYSGKIKSIPGSRAYFVFTKKSVFANIDLGERIFALDKRFAPDEYIMRDIFNEPISPGYNCGTYHDLSAEKTEKIYEILREQIKKENSSTLNDKHLTVEIAIETDHYLLEQFQNDSTELAAYVSGLIGVVSQIFERDVNTSLKISYLNIRTDGNDPYPDGDVSKSKLLYQFREYWNQNMTDIHRDVAVYFSGRDNSDSRGGVANIISGFCETDRSYAFCNMNGYYSKLPLFSYDVHLVAHEIGHLFGSVHTHSCIWPGGAIDSCAGPDHGDCFEKRVKSRGTIMSYCHAYGHGSYLKFHPWVAKLIRGYLERSDCTGSVDDTEYIYNLSGRIFSKNEPKPDIKLKLSRYHYTWKPLGGTEAVSDENGNYKFTEMCSGYYHLNAPEGYSFKLPSGEITGRWSFILPGTDLKKDFEIYKSVKTNIKIHAEPPHDD